MNIVSFLTSVGIALLVTVPLGLLCLWASYRLGRRLRLTDQTVTLVSGIGVFPLPFVILGMVAVGILLRLMHLPHDGQSGAAAGIAAGGWMGTGAARLENLKRQGQ